VTPEPLRIVKTLSQTPTWFVLSIMIFNCIFLLQGIYPVSYSVAPLKDDSILLPFGNIKLNVSSEAHARWQNDSSFSYRIVNVLLPCGCINVNFGSGHTILPGSTRDLVVSITKNQYGSFRYKVPIVYRVEGHAGVFRLNLLLEGDATE